jgi:hypothetical protein
MVNQMEFEKVLITLNFKVKKNDKYKLHGIEFAEELKEGMSYIIDDDNIKGIVCNQKLYNKSIEICMRDMKKIYNKIKKNQIIHYNNYKFFIFYLNIKNN